MSTTDLLPCPVCQGAASIYACGDETRAVCDVCDVAGPPAGDCPTELYALGTPREEVWADGAAHAWNEMPARKLMASPDARLAVMAAEMNRRYAIIVDLGEKLRKAKAELSARGQGLDWKAQWETARADLARAKADRDVASRQALLAAHEADLLRARAEKAERELQKWVPRPRGAASAADPGDRFALIEVD